MRQRMASTSKKSSGTRQRLGLLFVSLLLVFFCAGGAWAAMGEISSFSLLDDANTDIAGKGTALGADGLKDAGFSVSLRGNGAITRITLADKISGRRWDTSVSSGGSLLAVRSEKGEMLNSGGKMALLAFVFGTRFSIWVNDRENTLEKDGTYELTVHFIDRSTVSSTLRVKGIAPAAVPLSGKPLLEPRILSAVLLGQKDDDYAGPDHRNKKIGKSGVNDWVTAVRLNATGTITGFRLHNVGGIAGVWDTFPNSDYPLAAVMSDGSVTLPRIFNRDDGSVSIPIKGEMTFYLLVENNGSLQDRRTSTVLSVYIDDKVVERIVSKERYEAGGSFDVLSFSFNGRGKYDFVGESPKPGSNLVPDLGLTLVMDAIGTVNGVRVTGTWESNGKKITKTWDTIPANTNPLVAVTRADGKRLNKNDSTLSFPVKGRETLYFWIDNQEDVGANATFRADVAFSDGRIMTASWSDKPTAAPAKSGPERSIRMTAKPAPLEAGVVGKTEAPSSGAKNNMSLLVRVRGSGSIVRMSLINRSGAGKWDTTPKNQIPLLGVRHKSKLLNAKDGTINIPLKDRIDLELVVEDNGSVKKGNARFLLSIAWSDGELTREMLAW